MIKSCVGRRSGVLFLVVYSHSPAFICFLGLQALQVIATRIGRKSLPTSNAFSACSRGKIGDSQIDIDEGKNAGCGLTYGITTGAQTEAVLRAAAPTDVVQSLSDFLTLVTNSP